MSNEGNEKMKRFLQGGFNTLLKLNEFSDIDKIEVFFVFGSQHKTAMCDWVYGIKIYSQMSINSRADSARSLQIKVGRATEKLLGVRVCCTDVIWVKDYE